MANTSLTVGMIAREALMILENNCIMGSLVYRGYESEFQDSYNGYTVGQTVSIRRPADFTVRDDRTASVQDVVEGKIALTVNKQKGVDFNFTSFELSLNIKELSDRVIRPAMIQVANQIDRDINGLYANVYNWVGDGSGTVNSFADFAKAPQRLDTSGVPTDERSAAMNPTDYWAFIGSQSTLYVQDVARDAIRRGSLGMIGGIDTYMCQNLASHTRGTALTGAIIANAGNTTTYASSLNSNSQSIGISINVLSATMNAGDVFTIDQVFAVNPVTKVTQNYLQQFVVNSTVTALGSTLSTAINITPPLITSGAFQTVSGSPAQSATITFYGTTASQILQQNLVFHRNAFGLVMVPMVAPAGAVSVARQSYKGYSVRVIPYYDGISDIANYRLDVLYGVKTLDPRLATRLNGSS